jgi:hypothetical protein
MTVPPFVLVTCCVAMIVLGIWVVYKAVTNPPRRGGPSEISVFGSKLSLKGPAWLIMIAVGALMTATPIIAAVIQRKSQAPFEPPVQAQVVATIDEPNYKNFRFTRDVSYLDLRNSLAQPWYAYLPGWRSAIGHHTRIRPASLLDYMVIRKVADSDYIVFTYSTSGLLDLRCLTHEYSVRTSYQNGQNVGEITADIRSVPTGSDFTLVIEATYWNAFSVADKEDFSTYTHNQAGQSEEMSILIIFPDAKPFKQIDVQETPPGANEMRQIQGNAESHSGPEHKTYYWSYVKAADGRWFYTASWDW